MPVAGLLLGRSLANAAGQAAYWIGAALLVATGLYAVVQAIRSPHREQGQGPAVPAGQRARRCWSPGRR